MIEPQDRISLNVKLRGSGQIINLSRMPDEFVDVLHDVISTISDPYTCLATWAYMFVGLSIDEIRERFIITERNKVKHVSREYIRQKIKGVYEDIYSTYTERYNTASISTKFYSKFTHVQNNSFIPDEIRNKIKEDVIEESDSIKEEESQLEPEIEDRLSQEED